MYGDSYPTFVCSFFDTEHVNDAYAKGDTFIKKATNTNRYLYPENYRDNLDGYWYQLMGSNTQPGITMIQSGNMSIDYTSNPTDPGDPTNPTNPSTPSTGDHNILTGHNKINRSPNVSLIATITDKIAIEDVVITGYTSVVSNW